MELRHKTVLILGGSGLVGQAIGRRLLKEDLQRLLIAGLHHGDAEACITALQRAYPNTTCTLEALAGDIFAPIDLKDAPREERLNDAEQRAHLTDLLLNPLSESIIRQSTLYQWCTTYRPDVIVDCVNTATAIAYKDVYRAAGQLRSVLAGDSSQAEMRAEVEQLLLAMPLPQLIRHVQIFWYAMCEAHTEFYLKIGTSGTGGLGINIPYTHSEEKASQLLLSKAGIAGAHSLLLFLLARTPEGPIVKEIKPAAFIGWKQITHGPIAYRGKPIMLEDCPFDAAVDPMQAATIGTQEWRTTFRTDADGAPLPLQAPYIDTGENGFWALGDFALITDQAQMEFVTPEEIAQLAVSEIKGRNTGHDIVAALDNSTVGPTYRAGYMRKAALAQLRKLEQETGVDSVSFEMGGPTTTKLLYEAYLLHRSYASLQEVLSMSAESISAKLADLIRKDTDLRSRIISIGIPILLPDSKQLLRGQRMQIPSETQRALTPAPTADDIDQWASEGWVDLRAVNWVRWRARIQSVLDDLAQQDPTDTSSFVARGHDYWQTDSTGNHPILISKLVSWIYRTEEHGIRMKD